MTKHLFDNRYGTGQSTIDGIIRATNILLAGKNFVVAGYGWCGRGLASRARGMGANVIVTEVDPLPALEAVMDGFRVMPMQEAATHRRYLCHRHRRPERDRPLAFRSHEGRRDRGQLGPFQRRDQHPGAGRDVESTSAWCVPLWSSTSYSDGRRIHLLGEGRLINLASAEGHPASVMDMSFANQALAPSTWSSTPAAEKKVYSVPEAIDREIARLKLRRDGREIDVLTDEQVKYLNSWEEGT